MDKLPSMNFDRGRIHFCWDKEEVKLSALGFRKSVLNVFVSTSTVAERWIRRMYLR
jgi:hypothetical protein